MLRCEAVTEGGILLLGVNDASVALQGREARAASHAALAPAHADKFTVLLKHQPVAESDASFDLQLSGHVHGGQIWPFGLITRLVYNISTGLMQLNGGRWLYVSRGVGTRGPPIRLFARPEITLFTIESEGK